MSSSMDTNVELIKQWLKQQPHLPDVWDESWIKTYLRSCDFSLEKCKKRLDLYFTMKNAAPEFYSDRVISKLRYITKYIKTARLPRLMEPQGYRVSMTSFTGLPFAKDDFPDYLKTMFLMPDVRMLQEDDKAAGDIYIIDYDFNFYTETLKYISVSQMKKVLMCLQEAYPLKLKGMHYLNASPILQSVLNMIKPFLKDKIRNRIFVHSSLNSLYEHVPQEILPEEYGGYAGTMDSLTEQWWNILEENEDWFKRSNGVKADESKRPGKVNDPDKLFGMNGSFRQLRID